MTRSDLVSLHEMKLVSKTLFAFFSLLLLAYVLLPNSDFPEPLPGALRSDEPADVETPLRRGYFTDFSREEVIAHYRNQVSRSKFLSLPLPTLRLNYPPEEAQTLIRDQARATFLEELAQPLRESFFINGFEPKEAKDAIVVNDKKWRQKVIVKHVPSNNIVRLLVLVPALMLIVLVFPAWFNELKRLFLALRK